MRQDLVEEHPLGNCLGCFCALATSCAFLGNNLCFLAGTSRVAGDESVRLSLRRISECRHLPSPSLLVKECESLHLLD